MNAPPAYSTDPTNRLESLRMWLELSKEEAKPKNRVPLSTCPLKVRQDFIRKVYTILFLQIVATSAVTAGIIHLPSFREYLLTDPRIFYGSFAGALSNTGVLVRYQYTFPANYLLLASFTAMEAVALGLKLATLDYILLLQALIITSSVFIGLSLFTLQSKRDFSGLGPFLYTGLISLIMAGMARTFGPFSSTENLIHALTGSLVFSGWILYDTSQLIDTLSPEEFIWGSLRLYLDFIGLFIFIVHLLGGPEKRKKEEQAKEKKEAAEKEKEEGKKEEPEKEKEEKETRKEKKEKEAKGKEKQK